MIMALPTLIGRLAVQNRSFEAAGIQAIREAMEHARGTEEDLMELFDGQLADEIQHVRYANQWIDILVRKDSRKAMDIVRAVTQANAAFRIIAGEALTQLVLDDQTLRETGFEAVTDTA
jgi:uncharacterized ferritin-like protein (DUF455 family)